MCLDILYNLKIKEQLIDVEEQSNDGIFEWFNLLEETE